MIQSCEIPPQLLAGFNFFVGAETGEGGESNVPGGLGSRGWNRSSGSPVTHVIFQLVWTVPVPIESAGEKKNCTRGG